VTATALRLALVASGGAVTVALWEAVRRTPFARLQRWQRTNFRGVPVSLLGGPVVIVATAAGCAVAVLAAAGDGRRTALALFFVVAGGGVAGVFDDLRGSSAARGLTGHLRAAKRGDITSGVIKLLALALCGLVAATTVTRAHWLLVIVDAALIAATANLANLFDLRPGRAAKLLAAGLLVVALASRAAITPIAWCVGVVVGIARYDLREQLMLGDGGANALGAALGVGFVVALPAAGRLTALAVVVGLTLLSEVVSFSRLIDASPPLRWLDLLGRDDCDTRVRS